MPHMMSLDLLQTSYKCCIDLPRSIAKQSCIKIAINIRIQITIIYYTNVVGAYNNTE